MLTRNDSLRSTKNCFLNANKVEYITLHYTACVAPAKNFCLNQMNNDLSNGGSAHDFVSETEWYQSIDPKHGAWSVGDDQGYGVYPFGITNYNSLNIEMISAPYTLPSEKTRQNAAEIVAYYMKVYNVPIGKVVRHYDATRKECPYGMHGKDNLVWENFIELVKKYYEGKVVKVIDNKYNGKYLNMGDWVPRWRLYDIYTDELKGEIIPSANKGLSYEILGCLEDTDKQKKSIIKTGFAGLVYVYHLEDGNSSITDAARYGVKVSEEGKKIEELQKENKELKDKVENAKKVLE